MAISDDQPDDLDADDLQAAELARLRTEVGRAAHDLANALGAVLNYAEFLAEDLHRMEAASGAEVYLPHLESAAHRALNLVTKLSETTREDGSRR